MVIKLDKLQQPDWTSWSFLSIPLVQFITLSSMGMVLTILISIPFRMAITRLQTSQPQAILVLGGDKQREIMAAQLAQKNPTLPIWISSGSEDQEIKEIFSDASVGLEKLTIDHRAKDTVTNFTSLVHDFQKQEIRHLYVITSDYHMLRASAIATIVLGSRGIAFSSISVLGEKPPESQLRVARDTARALVWVVTGYTGVSLKNHLAVKK